MLSIDQCIKVNIKENLKFKIPFSKKLMIGVEVTFNKELTLNDSFDFFEKLVREEFRIMTEGSKSISHEYITGILSDKDDVDSVFMPCPLPLYKSKDGITKICFLILTKSFSLDSESINRMNLVETSLLYFINCFSQNETAVKQLNLAKLSAIP